MASTWYINDTDLATLGVTDLKIRFCNRADDVATWTCDGKALDSAASFATGTGITIKKGSSTVFRGVVTSLPRYGTGTAQRVSYEARGGWYFLGKVFYTQKWPKSVSGLLHSKTRVVLGYEGNDSGTHGQQCSATRQLKDIVTVAHDKAASHIAGSTSCIDVSSIKLPADEEVDLTCADAINRVLRWFPDTVVWFDHAQSPPVCHMKRRADIPDIQYLSAANAEEVELTPRDDLVVPGVSIDYEITSASSNKTYKDVQTDSANAGNPSALGAAHFTVQLDGGSSHYLWQSVTSEALPSTRPAPTLDALVAWGNFIQQYIPELDRQGAFEDFSLVSPDVWPPRYQVPGTQTYKILDHVLLRGEIQPWMADKYAAETRLEFKASYTDVDGDVSLPPAADRRAGARVVAEAAFGEGTFEPVVVAARAGVREDIHVHRHADRGGGRVGDEQRKDAAADEGVIDREGAQGGVEPLDPFRGGHSAASSFSRAQARSRRRPPRARSKRARRS